MFSKAISRNSFLSMDRSLSNIIVMVVLAWTTTNAQNKTKMAEQQKSNQEGFSNLVEIKQINAGDLNIGYKEMGPHNGKPVILLHGWPYDIHSYIEVAPILAAKGYRVLIPYLRGFGTTKFLSEKTIRNGQQSVFAVDIIAFMDALKIEKAIIGGFDWGARTALIMAALWPERCKGIVSVSGYIIINLEKNQNPLTPNEEYAWWYQYYFSTQRGKEGYSMNTYEFNKLIWKLASPKWNFDEQTYAQTATSYNNPDHVEIVIHNYRWRLLLEKGETKYRDLENKLAKRPVINVPAITIGSDFDGKASNGNSYRDQFTGKYSHKIFNEIGHNVPQEAPVKFADAIMEVDSYSK